MTPVSAPASRNRPHPLSGVLPHPRFLSPNIPGGSRAPGAAGGQRPSFAGPARGAAR